MTAPVSELQELPYGLVLDGELAAGKGNEATGKSPVSLTSQGARAPRLVQNDRELAAATGQTAIDGRSP
jgi:hypothetical protein